MKNKLLACFLFLSCPLCATHMRCGYISVDVVNSASRTCRITITVFTDAGFPVLFGGEQSTLDFGDGTFVVVPETDNMPRPDLGPHVGMASYSVFHTFGANGYYTIQFLEPSRNAGIINMENSIITPFSVETNVVLDPLFGSFASPDFLVDPFFTAALGSDLTLSVGAYSNEEAYEIRYEVATPGLAVNYKLPENFSINPYNGLIAWDTKFMDQYIAGEFIFAVNIHLFKKIDDVMIRVCTITRDFQIVLTDSGVGGEISDNRELDENNRIYTPENETSELKVFYEVVPPMALTAYSELSENDDVFSFTVYDSSSNPNIKVGVLTLTNLPGIVRDAPYHVTVRGRGEYFCSDINYLFYTKDQHPQVITGSEGALADVTFFPNPVKDFVTISLSQNQQGKFSVFDQTGHLVAEGFLAGSTTIDLRALPAGFYYGRLQSGSAVRILKLIKR